ncbi:MAG: hypothetical protein NTV07_06095 [Candidatus Omnitrophica bacterium]|nr:hypothetical protein [Candidatus Omnitrophota bacterium]
MKKEPDFDKLKLYSIRNRKSKVSVVEFAKPAKKGASFANFYDGLPDILAVKSLRAVADSLALAKKRKKTVIFMAGAHVIKCGLSPLVIDLMERGVIKAVAMNGAGIIHDTEIAMAGKTSEDVDAGILDGSFGMAEETSLFINKAINLGCRLGFGIGEVLGKRITEKKFKYRHLSILAAAHRLGIPVTVHVAIGTDIIHQHPLADGAAIGEGSMADFKKLVRSVSSLGGGGVVLNFGSAVILPEVFLKAINIARNLGFRVKDFTAANFDMYTHYRPTQNILLRPTQKGFGKGYNIIGHHEIMLPLLYRSLIEKI